MASSSRRTAAIVAGSAIFVAGATAIAGANGIYDTPQYGTRASSHSTAKNVILLIGDGMGVTHITAARQRFYGAA